MLFFVWKGTRSPRYLHRAAATVSDFFPHGTPGAAAILPFSTSVVESRRDPPGGSRGFNPTFI